MSNINLDNFKVIDINLQISGVYCLYNEKKVYVGSSVNVYTRIRRHFRELKNNKHNNSYLQRAYNLDDDFHAILLEQVDDKYRLLIREQYWINYFKSYNPAYGYNLCQFAGNTLGIKRTDKEKENLSKIFSGKILSIETRNKISESRKGIVFTDNHRNNISKSLTGRKLPDNVIEKLHYNNAITVYQYDLNGNYIRSWISAAEVQKELNIDQSSIRKCCNGILHKAGGFIWRNFLIDKLILDKKKVVQKDLNNNIIKIWNSVSEISKELKFNSSAIYQCCCGNWEKYKNFIWSYI